jgi:starch synthase
MSFEPLKIAIISPEFFPLAKTGGLGDITSALSKALGQLGHQVRVFLPCYQTVQNRGQIKDSGLKPISLQIGDMKVSVSLRSTAVSDSPAEIFLVEAPNYYDRPELLRDPGTGLPYPDNDERFILFCRATLEFIKQSGFQPDVIQANDWQAALVCAYLKTLYAEDKFYSQTSCLLSLNNLALQGIFPKGSFSKTGLPGDVLGQFEFHGKISFLKGGILFADILSTVSETYAVEIQSSAEFGNGLEGALRQRNSDLYGILNGADYSEWSPETDRHIPFRYGLQNLSDKKKNKEALLKECGFSAEKLNWPALGMVTRLVDQKGLDLLPEMAAELLQKEVVLIILGKGEAKYEHLLRELEKKYPDRVKIFIGFDERMAHLVTAGADLYLMPSKFEPCGLNQLYSLKYGTVPVVRATGGLLDTVQDYRADGSGTGFVFQGYYSFEFLEAIERALEVYQDKKSWEKLQRNGMNQNFSWIEAAEKYVELYKLAKKSG